MIKQNNKHKLLLSFIVVVLMLILPLGSGLADEQAIPQTGFEKSNGARWTTHQEELDFLEELSQKSNRIRYTLEGTTGEGRPLHLVRVGDPLPATDEEIASGRTILIVGTFHGNEPSGREMALKLMRDLAFTEEPDMLELMSKSTILFIPTVNPDGREANVRRNKDDFDPNRDAITLKTPEVQTLARIQKQFKPDLVLDAHERTSGPNLSLLGGLSLNMDDALYELNADLVDNYLFPQLEDAGFTVEYYPPSGRPTNTRGMAGLKHSIPVLVEASWTDDFSRRVEGQMKNAELILQYYHDHFDQIGQVVSAAPNNKKEIGANRSQPFYLDGMRGLGGTEDELPPESAILNPPPCGYLINGLQKDKISRQIDLFEIETEPVNGGYFITMAQPMMTVIPLILDENSEFKLVNGLAVDDCADLNSLTPPSNPIPQQYQTDFEGYEVGEAPHDWTSFWADSGWTIKDNPSRLEHMVTEGEGRRLLTWNEVGEVHGDVEVAALVRADSDGQLFQLHLHSSGKVDSETSYYLDVFKTPSANNIRINRLIGGRHTELINAELPFPLEVDTWYQVVFQREGTTLKGKVWPYGQEEPSSWQVTFDDIYIDYGHVGVGHVSAGMINDWKFLSVGTYGAEAVRAPDDLIGGVDKSVLQRRVEQIKAENLNEAYYTTESWQNLQTALNRAEELLNKSDATQVEIDEALENLYKAYLALSAQYQTDFSEYASGSVPEDWSTLWRESGWTIKDNPSRLEHFVTEGGKRRVLTWEKAGDVNGDVEVSAVVRRIPTEQSGGVMFQLHLQGSGNAGSESSYYLDLTNSGKVRINRNLNGAFKSLKSADVPFTTQTDTWYQVVFKREGNSLKGKVWPYGEDEPADWQVEIDDESLVSGKVGVGHITSGVMNEWAFFGVGIGQMEAPRAPGNLFEPTEPGVDKTALQAKVNEINEELADGSLVEDDYTLESWQALQEKLTAAQTVLGNDEATQIEVDQALAALETARTGLKLKESPATRPLLQNLEIPGVTLSPTFTPEITKYRGTVTNDVYQITIKASVTDDVYQQVMFNPDNPVNLVVGENTLTVKVIDANDVDLYTKYEIIITREPSSGNGGDDNSDGDNGDDNGSGGSGDSSGGGSSNQEKKPDEDKPKPSTGFIITPKDIIGKAKDGKVTVEVGAETEIQLPVNILELLNSSDVEVQGNRVTLVLPNEVLQQLSKLVAANELEDAHISLTFGSVDHAESERLLTRAENTGNVTLQQASDILDLSLSITTKDGQVNNLTRFEKPIALTFNVKENVNTNLLGVYFIADNGSLEYIGGTLSSGTMSVALHHFSKYVVLEFKKTYTDVPTSHWAMNVIQELSAKHIIKGITEREFAPNLHVTRAEFAALIARSLGLESTKHVSFSDVNSDAWYAKEVAAAAEAGIVAGLSETIFAPDAHINREQMAAMIVRAYEYMHKDQVSLSATSTFDDDEEISSWAKGYVNAAAELKFVQGRGNNEFVAKGIANRAEAAQIIYNFLK